VTSESVARGRAALRRGDAVAARVAFQQAGAAPEALEGLATASFVLLEYPRAIEEMERAYAAFRAAGDTGAAARVARTLGGMHGSTGGDWAVANGWIGRAKTLLSDHPGTSEPGWVALTEGMFAPRRADKDGAFLRALEVGRATEDADLAFCALAYLGASLVHADRASEGMSLLDESLAAVVGDEVDSFMVIEEIFCQLFSACEHVRDVRRAEQWIRVGDQVAERRRLPAVSAYCRTHYGGILTAAGRWEEAERTLTQAVREWVAAGRTLRTGAVVRLADLRVRQGRYDEAGLLLDGVEDGDALPVAASLHLALGEPQAALGLVERALATAEPGAGDTIPLLALRVDAQVASGSDPGESVTRLAAAAAAHPSDFAEALLARARALTATDGEVARRWLEVALTRFQGAGLPLEAALCRLELGASLQQLDPVRTAVEARAALRTFERLQAARHADAASALMRRVGVRVAPPAPSGEPLTRRERQVLDLLGQGLSNPQIAARLFISRKTVEHHVGNVLLKLGLRNRSEAAAHAVLHRPAVEPHAESAAE
jgi:DNA-binding CsgD family transcriptional regulator